LGDYAGALSQLEDVLAADDTSAEAHYLRGLCLRDSGALEAAVEAFEAAISRSPGLIPAREELADVYGELRRFSAEIEQLQVIAGLDRADVDRQVEVGMALARAARSARNPATAQRNDDLAILTLGSALERAPDSPGIYGALGKAWLDIAVARDDRVALSKALEAFDRVVTGPSVPGDVLSAYGRALALEGELGAAERVLAQAIRQYPVETDALIAYANVAESRGQYDAARRALIEYDALVNDREGMDRRARRIAALSLRLEDPATAIAWLERVLVTSPEDAGLLASLTDAYLRAGDVPSAHAVLARGLAAHPQDERLQALAKKSRLPE
jgi:tetratricopeptide (TPR) repeat protein